MRKTLTASAFVLAAALLTGCGGGEEEPAGAAGGKAPATGAAGEAKEPEKSGGGADGGVAREVTIEVTGTGASTVMYTLEDSGFEKVTLPWKKTAAIAPRGAEAEVGRLVLVTPGSMKASDGTYVMAGCTITVGGETVVEKKPGSSGPCSYKLK
ncbi:hypothetical protein CP967_09745 [Streptomyces nitrosporeus]|uniref:MmpS family membrane protein n=1 Tax=Streptomyces nitrosporeus TaxID=28894 RepID=A0A5J6F9G2_9ACTN|nr:hypothetical protein [Streptomyces nitrosporeus]QEU72224.1 hypothetical protein CP967_09745 [Streptomyces nitrosporeus]GGY79576.1 hypothetical protein GCM10010327_07510 [Streptomyces nitrosporeus]